MISYLLCMNASDDQIAANLLHALVRSKTQIEVGDVVPMEPVLHRLGASIARMEARQAEQEEPPARKA